jgi:hypothetical protein
MTTLKDNQKNLTSFETMIHLIFPRKYSQSFFKDVRAFWPSNKEQIGKAI